VFDIEENRLTRAHSKGEVRFEAPFVGDVGVMVTSLIGQRSTIARRRLIVFTTEEIDSEHER
jgi:hypothetical protein